MQFKLIFFTIVGLGLFSVVGCGDDPKKLEGQERSPSTAVTSVDFEIQASYYFPGRPSQGLKFQVKSWEDVSGHGQMGPSAAQTRAVEGRWEQSGQTGEFKFYRYRDGSSTLVGSLIKKGDSQHKGRDQSAVSFKLGLHPGSRMVGISDRVTGAGHRQRTWNLERNFDLEKTTAVPGALIYTGQVGLSEAAEESLQANESSDSAEIRIQVDPDGLIFVRLRTGQGVVVMNGFLSEEQKAHLDPLECASLLVLAGLSASSNATPAVK